MLVKIAMFPTRITEKLMSCMIKTKSTDESVLPEFVFLLHVT